MYRLVKDYKENDGLRKSFDILAQETFGLTFEDWYQNGYWQNKYIPYSIVKEDQVVANVSVNLMNMLWDGRVRHFIQLGTVMTAKDYRNQGLIRRIVEAVEEDFTGKAEAMYLFANDSVLDFYPKFGYERVEKYSFFRQTYFTGEATVQQVPMKEKRDWDLLERVIRNNQFHGKFDMAENVELIMFYVTKFMQGNVYFDPCTGAYMIAEREGEELTLHAVFVPGRISLEQIIRAFGSEIKRVVLGFTPAEIIGFDCKKVAAENDTLFMKGPALREFQSNRLMFPTLSHA